MARVLASVSPTQFAVSHTAAPRRGCKHYSVQWNFVSVAVVTLSSAGFASSQTPTTKPAASQAGSATIVGSGQNRVKMDTSLYGTWRIARGALAPWVHASDKSWNTKSLVGQTVRFESKRVSGPASLRCAGVVNYEATNYAADALFQGALPVPAAKALNAATDLGFTKLPAKGTSLNCDAGLFEFHQVDATTELVAINNVIWTLDRAPGALAVATSPAGVVQRFLETHFANTMGFDSTTFGAKRKYVSTALAGAVQKYFAKPVRKGEVPDVDGDPFTDTQEYPTRFSVGAATTAARAATVRVKCSDAHVVTAVTYLLAMESGVWRIDDVRYVDGPTFRALLGSPAK
ncbi:MAG: DUF3828 domain-containing protein [Gemmatimonadaceae bacterium]